MKKEIDKIFNDLWISLGYEDKPKFGDIKALEFSKAADKMIKLFLKNRKVKEI